ncbi:TrmH family RNA methyltransferase [Streptomyces bohaiensis]|uniref:RNA methyltransferase n=1 Tax=Streptomyces bohaiensis TaxID=1431344 RepID=A0ABX1C710_9ACTN|nr:RNA methyltransferase [Streptomyces bohaiensis]NJQ14021.1 RNA methyltransferase [Streptomyces bohaiensis]
MTATYEQQRHKEPGVLSRPRELVVAVAPLKSRVNLSTILRAAGCCGVTRVIACGNAKVDPTVARDSLDQITVEVRRTLPPVLKALREDGYRIVGLEQTTNSVSLHTYRFPRRTALVVGNERLGITEEELRYVDDCVEIPVWGAPHSYNVATATSMGLYEYCRQFPEG